MISVGLEVSGNAIKVAVLDGGRTSARLRDFVVRRLDARTGDAEDDIVSVLKETLGKLKVPATNVVTSVRAQDCVVREISVPFREDEKIRKTIKYQAENFFTSTSIDDLIIEYSKFAESGARSKLLVAGIKKSHIERRLRFLQECGVDPVAIDLDMAALYNAYAHVGAFQGKDAVLMVEIEAETLKVGVVEDGKLRLARALRVRLGAMELETKAGKRPAGGPGESGIYETAADESARLPVVILDEGEDEAFSLEDSQISEQEREGMLHRVFLEIDRTVASVHLTKEIQLICLTGASCALDGIEPIFSEHFEIEARRIDLAAALGAPADKKAKGETSVSLEGATAVGLALRGLGVAHSAMDFRQEEFAFRGTFERLKKSLACTLTLLFALVFLYAFTLKQELKEKRNALLGVKSLQKNLYTFLFPSLNDPNAEHLPLRQGEGRYYESLVQESNLLRQRYGGSGTADRNVSRVSALEILRQFALAKSRVDPGWAIEVVRISIDPRPSAQSRFECTARDEPAAVELARAFEENPLVTGTARDTRRDPRSNKVVFEFIVRLREQPR